MTLYQQYKPNSPAKIPLFVQHIMITVIDIHCVILYYVNKIPYKVYVVVFRPVYLFCVLFVKSIIIRFDPLSMSIVDQTYMRIEFGLFVNN